MSDLPTGEPRIAAETLPFWQATAEGRIELPVCDACGLVVFYPRSLCPDCHSTDLTWTPLSGRGTVYSFSVIRAGVSRKWREHLPYVVAYVELDEGPRMLTNVVDVDPEAVEIGMAVTAVFDPAGGEPREDGLAPAIVRFRPID